MSPQVNPKISPPGGAEPELIARARKGDREAFAALYNDHQPIVYRYLVCRTRNPQLAEDLTQDVFVRALRRIDAFTWQGTDFTAWLVTIARNLHFDYVKSGRARLEAPVAEIDASYNRDRSAESTALRDLDAVEAVETLQRAMTVLNPYQRRCVELRYLRELSIEETARELGKNVRAVKTLTFRAMQKLRAELRPAGEAVAA